jgi:hypothetical protein
MQVKIFMDSQAGKIEEQVNHWFANEAGPVYVVKTETAIAAAADAAAYPCIVVTVWYEPDAAA